MTIQLTEAESDYLASLVDADLERVATHPPCDARDRRLIRLRELRQRLGRSLECANEKCNVWFFTTRKDRTYCSARCSDNQKQRAIRRREKAAA